MSSHADASAGVRRARERFLSEGRLGQEALRTDVLDSWRRSQAFGVHPGGMNLPFVREPDTDSPLTSAAAPVLDHITEDLSAQAVSLILTSSDGVVLQRLASDPAIMNVLDTVRLAPGYSYAEEFVGTNGIGTAVETGRPTFIRGDEHYAGTLTRLACAGAPIRDPISRRIVGVLDLTCWAGQSDPLQFALAKTAAAQIEERMRSQAHASERALLEAYLEQARRFPLGVLAIGGDVVLMNTYLRQALAANDQIALLEHASDLLAARVNATVLAVLPSGTAVKMSAVEQSVTRGGRCQAVFHIHVAADAGARVLGADPARERVIAVGRDALSMLAEQQASLRRVATLVARGVEPSEVFATVADELARCLNVAHAALVRRDSDGAAVLLAGHHESNSMKIQVGERFSPGGDTVAAMVLRTGEPARTDRREGARGVGAAYIRALDVSCTVGAPIVVDGRLWGAAIVGSTLPGPLPPDTEARVGDFADLVATAIANAEARAQLTASRARIVAAADDARRRFERDLHDGAQQHLVSLGLQLRAAEAAVPTDLRPLKDQIAHIATDLGTVSQELREISHGLHPTVLSSGLAPALKALGRRSAVPVQLHIGVDVPVPEHVQVTAYYVVAEALTNAAKHAHASSIEVSVDTEDATLRLLIHDDGDGGADAARGSGLTGLIDRVEAHAGTLEILSPIGQGTSLAVEIPFEVV